MLSAVEDGAGARGGRLLQCEPGFKPESEPEMLEYRRNLPYFQNV